MATPIEVDGIPVVDVAAWLNREDGSAACEEECAKVAAALHQYGIICVKDPRVSSEDNDRYVVSGAVSASTSEPLQRKGSVEKERREARMPHLWSVKHL